MAAPVNTAPSVMRRRRPYLRPTAASSKIPVVPFAACLNVIDPESYFRDCVYDVCMGNGDRKMLCHSIAAYVSDCQDFGVAIKDWRTPTFCRKCP